MTASETNPSFRVLICTPTGRDAPLIADHLQKNGIESTICPSVHDICKEFHSGAGMAIIAEEALTEPHMRQLVGCLQQQAVWSDFSILILASKEGETTDYVYNALSTLGNLNILERPLQPITLLTAVKNILRARRRQYELKAHLKERVQMTEALASLNTDLERRVEERTHELAKYHDALLQSQKMEAIGRLAGGVAHDFNNLLTGIIGITEDIRDSFPAGDSRRPDLDSVISAGQRAFVLTKQLLAFGRRQTVELENIDLHKAISDAAFLLTRLIGEDIHLELHLDAPESFVRSSVSYLEQILFNIVINARDAMPDGGRIKISTRIQDVPFEEQSVIDVASGSYLVLGIEDSGTGISEEVLKHIFEPYFTTKSKGKGSGLGLATVYGIVRQIGGNIQIHTRVGAGTLFEIFLPKTGNRDAASKVLSEPDNKKPKSGTILLIEDEDIVRIVTTRKLKKAGYNVLEACDGKEAIAIAEKAEKRIDLVITDIVLPGLNGREAAEAVQKQMPEIKILFVSGYSEDIISEKGVLQSGINFLDKTNLNSQLLSKVEQLLSH